MKLREKHKDWLCDESKMKKTAHDSIFMHCLPIRRNIVATDGVIDGPHSAIYEEAWNRLHVQKAILATVMKDE